MKIKKENKNCVSRVRQAGQKTLSKASRRLDPEVRKLFHSGKTKKENPEVRKWFHTGKMKIKKEN